MSTGYFRVFGLKVASLSGGKPAGRAAVAGIAAALCAVLLVGCASTAPGGRAQITMPTALSSVYSSVDMNMRLGAAESIAGPCAGVQCQANAAFDKQVERLGLRLAQSAYEAYPDLKERVPVFKFEVAEKAQPGTTSNASGTIVVYRGTRNAKLDEKALAFVISREMGHVVARHHDERSASGLMFSVAAQVFLPIVNVTRVIATIASSAASTWGPEALTEDKSTDQIGEADRVAFDLLVRQGWTAADLADSLSGYALILRDGPWSASIRHVAAACERERLLQAIAALQKPPSLDIVVEAPVTPPKRATIARLDRDYAAPQSKSKTQLVKQ